MLDIHTALTKVPKRTRPFCNHPRLLDQLRERIRCLHHSLRTEEAYVYWVRIYIRFHQRRQPAEMGKAEIEAFLSFLVNKKNLSASTHRQALSSILFLY